MRNGARSLSGSFVALVLFLGLCGPAGAGGSGDGSGLGLRGAPWTGGSTEMVLASY
jgi:hypothetical protein